MFRVYEIKNAHRRGKNAVKIEAIPIKDMFIKRADERTVPYFSIVREQFFMDERINMLRIHERANFLYMCVDIWAEGGLLHNFSKGNADRFDMPEGIWEEFLKKLLHLGLLVLDSKGLYLIQPELREQYFQFLNAHPGGAKNVIESGFYAGDDLGFDDDDEVSF